MEHHRKWRFPPSGSFDTPKCLVELAGVTLLDRTLEVLRSFGIHDITIVTGHKAERFGGGDFRTLLNPEYQHTNMVHSLFKATNILTGGEPVLISYGDIVYEPSVLKSLIDCDAPVSICVDTLWERYWKARMVNPLDDAESLRLNDAGDVTEIGRKPDDI